MTIGTTTTITCDGCANGAHRVVTTSWSLTGPPAGTKTWKRSTVLKDLGWKQFHKTTKGQRRDFCPDCVTKGLAK